jgi:ribonucleoside-triphosphate reductase
MTPAWGPIGQEVYERTYQRREDSDWSATVRRVVKGNLALVPEEHREPGEAEALENLLLNFQALPAGRHLWASGADTKLGLFNCHRAGWTAKLSDHFSFTFDQLMLGGGVGANYSQNYLDKAPVVGTVVSLALSLDSTHPDYDEVRPHLSPREGSVPATVADSREGWVVALSEVIDAHTQGRHYVALDLSAVRPRGATIHGFGGTASGPGPLASMLQEVNHLLNGAHGRKLTPLEAMDIDHAIASCVVAGNVRRSARMSILHWRDPSIFSFIECKADHQHHWSTNISVEVDNDFFEALGQADAHAQEVLRRVVEGIYVNGEPGFYNSSLASEGETGDVRATNPCGEIALEEWEQCCLGHVNLAAFADDHEGALDAFYLMARYLVRATFGKASDARQEAVKARNRRIGVGFFGFHDWAALQGVRFEDIPRSPELRRRLVTYREHVWAASAAYASELGIPEPIKSTTVAPTGSIAKLPGVSEGLQPPYARFFVRRVRYASTDPKLLGLRGHHQEPCVYTDNTTVVSFMAHDPLTEVVAPDLIQQSDEVSLESYLEVQALIQSLWADNAVSITANFRREDATPQELANLLQKHLPTIKGWTGMPEDGRPQSPYERLTLDEYVMAESASAFQAMEDCSSGACPIR